MVKRYRKMAKKANGKIREIRDGQEVWTAEGIYSGYGRATGTTSGSCPAVTVDITVARRFKKRGMSWYKEFVRYAA